MKALIGSLIVALVVAVFTYQLQKKAPDVRYSLSERIPVTFATSDDVPSESVQRLEVRNVGNLEANEVQVRLNARVTWFKLLKHSEGAQTSEFPTRIPFELIYRTLPPDAAFVIIFKSPGSVPNSALAVRHSGGGTSEALAKSNASTWLTVIMLALSLAQLTTTAVAFKSGLESRFADRLTHARATTILSEKKPWFLSSQRWAAAVKEALLKRASATTDTLAFLEQIDATIVLRMSRPAPIGEAVWIEVVAAATDAFKTSFREILRASWSNVTVLYQFDRPANLSPKVWSDLRAELQAKHLSLITPSLWEELKITELLANPPAEVVGSKDWERLRESLQSDVGRLVAQKVVQQEHPWSVLATREFDALTDAQKRHVRTLAYEVEFASYRRQLRRSDAVPENKPDWMSESDFSNIVSEARERIELERARDEVRRAEHVADVDRAEIRTLKTRLEWQLKTIHEILTDPTSADRIEEYADRFAPGNLANLKRLAEAERKGQSR